MVDLPIFSVKEASLIYSRTIISFGGGMLVKIPQEVGDYEEVIVFGLRRRQVV